MAVASYRNFPYPTPGVSVYREAERDFSAGDRVQFTSPYRDEHIANRQLGTVEQIDSEGNLQIRLDSGRGAQSNIREPPHLDYGHPVTSHGSQGATANRVLVHVDTEQAHDQLINSRLAYVSVSRGRYDAQIYTNDAQNLSEELSRETSKRSALEAGMGSGHSRGDAHAQEESRTEGVSQSAEVEEREQTQQHGMAMED